MMKELCKRSMQAYRRRRVIAVSDKCISDLISRCPSHVARLIVDEDVVFYGDQLSLSVTSHLGQSMICHDCAQLPLVSSERPVSASKRPQSIKLDMSCPDS